MSEHGGSKGPEAPHDESTDLKAGGVVPREQGGGERSREREDAEVEELARTFVAEEVTPEVLTAAADVAGASAKEKDDALRTLETKEGKEGLVERSKAFLKARVPSFLSGVASGGAAMGTRYGARLALSLTFGSSVGAGIVAGALTGAAAGAFSGAAIEGARAYFKERRRVSVEDIRRQIFNAKNEVERGAITAKAWAAYREARINGTDEEVKDLAEALRERMVYLRAFASEKEGGGRLEKEKALHILKIMDGVRKEIPRSKVKGVEALIRKVRFESDVRWDKVRSGMWLGMQSGAVGGALGGALASWLSGHMPSLVSEKVHTIAHSEEVHIPHEIPHVPTPEVMTLAQGAEVSGAAVRSALEHGHGELLQQQFHEAVGRGEGVTKVVRKAIHDFLAAEHRLDPSSPMLSPEQAVYAEEYYTKKMGSTFAHTLKTGHELVFGGSDLQEAVDHARALSEEQTHGLSKLLKTPGHRLARKVSQMLADAGHFFNPQNDFATPILEHANQEAKEAVASLLAHPNVAAPTIVDHIQTITTSGTEVTRRTLGEAATAVLRKFFSTQTENIMFEAAGGLVLGGSAHQYLKRRRERKHRAKEEKENKLRDHLGYLVDNEFASVKREEERPHTPRLHKEVAYGRRLDRSTAKTEAEFDKEALEGLYVSEGQLLQRMHDKKVTTGKDIWREALALYHLGEVDGKTTAMANVFQSRGMDFLINSQEDGYVIDWRSKSNHELFLHTLDIFAKDDPRKAVERVAIELNRGLEDLQKVLQEKGMKDERERLQDSKAKTEDERIKEVLMGVYIDRRGIMKEVQDVTDAEEAWQRVRMLYHLGEYAADTHEASQLEMWHLTQVIDPRPDGYDMIWRDKVARRKFLEALSGHLEKKDYANAGKYLEDILNTGLDDFREHYKPTA